MKCTGIQDTEKQLRKYRPRSDFLISHYDLPRLLVEVNSSTEHPWPKDLIRMLLQGAAIVHFANRFLKVFRQQRNFVLCAIFIRGNGNVSHYTLYQSQSDGEVYWALLHMSKLESSCIVGFL